MKRVALLALLTMGLSQTSMAQAPSQLVGTWNVTSNPTGDSNFENPPKTSSDAFIWIVSASPNGEVTVSVQGETAFPKLHGRWRSSTRTLILNGQSVGLGGRRVCWFKLLLDEKGALRGVRRYLDSSPAFMDFEIIAKRS